MHTIQKAIALQSEDTCSIYRQDTDVYPAHYRFIVQSLLRHACAILCVQYKHLKCVCMGVGGHNGVLTRCE